MVTPTEPIDLARLHAHDRDEWARLYARAHVPLSSYLARFDRSQADDLTAETWLRAFRGIRQLRDTSRCSVLTWLFAVGRNTALDAVRRTGRRPREDTLAGVECVRDAVPTMDPADDLLRFVRPASAVAAWLRWAKGYKYEEIAAMVGAPLGSVKSMLNRARSDIMAGLQE